MLDTKYLVAIAVLVVVIVFVIYYMQSSSTSSIPSTPITPSNGSTVVPVVINNIDLTHPSYSFSSGATVLYTYHSPGIYCNSAETQYLCCYTENYNGTTYYYGVSCGLTVDGTNKIWYPSVSDGSLGLGAGIFCFNPAGVTTPVLSAAQLAAIGVDTNVVVGTTVLTTANLLANRPKIVASTSGPTSVNTDPSSTSTKTVINIVW